MMLMLCATSLFLSLVVLADIARIDALRIVVYPKPLFPHLWRYGSISFTLYRCIDYGWPTLAKLYISMRYHRHISFQRKA